MLRIKTTHLKEDYIRRNGAMASDQAKVTTLLDPPRRLS